MKPGLGWPGVRKQCSRQLDAKPGLDFRGPGPAAWPRRREPPHTPAVPTSSANSSPGASRCAASRGVVWGEKDPQLFPQKVEARGRGEGQPRFWARSDTASNQCHSPEPASAEGDTPAHLPEGEGVQMASRVGPRLPRSCGREPLGQVARSGPRPRHTEDGERGEVRALLQRPACGLGALDTSRSLSSA